MPERLVLHGNGGVSPQESREACDPFALHRVALLWHGGAPRLTGAEGLTQLINLAVLQVANLGCETFERAARDRDCGNERRMPITLDNLRAHRIHAQLQRGERLTLNLRADLAVGPNWP